MYLLSLLAFLAAIVSTAAPLSAAPIQWQAVTEIARGPGEKGPWQQNDSRYHYVDDPAVLIDEQGKVSVAWVDQSQKRILFQRYAPDGRPQLQQPVDVSRQSHTFSWLPRMGRAPDNPNEIYLLWQEIIFSGGSHGGDILFARSSDNGTTFSPSLNLSRSIGGDGKGRINADVWDNGSYDLVAGPNGAVYVAWTEYEGRLRFSRSTDGGRTFSRPHTVTGADRSLPARAPSVALGADGAVYLAWTVGEDAGADIHVSRSDDAGIAFSQPVVVAASGQYADAPKLAVGANGLLHLVYAQSEGGPFSRYQIHYTHSEDKGRSFKPARSISRPVPAAAEGARYPSLSVDGTGRVYVSYELYPDHRGGPRGLGISISMDDGHTFSLPAAVPNSADPDGGINGSHQGRLMKKLAVSRDGRIVIVNSSLKRDVQSRVWMMQGHLRQ